MTAKAASPLTAGQHSVCSHVTGTCAYVYAFLPLRCQCANNTSSSFYTLFCQRLWFFKAISGPCWSPPFGQYDCVLGWHPFATASDPRLSQSFFHSKASETSLPPLIFGTWRYGALSSIIAESFELLFTRLLHMQCLKWVCIDCIFYYSSMPFHLPRPLDGI